MKTINFAVEDSVYNPFKYAVENNGMRVAGLFRIFMKSYSEGKITISNGDVVSVGITTEHRKPGRPPVHKEELKGESSKKTFSYNKENPWESEGIQDIKYGDLPDRNWTHAMLEPHKKLLTFLTEGKNTACFEDFARDLYIDERPKFTDKEWFPEEYKKFLSRVTWMFILKNGYEDMTYSEEHIWIDALNFRDINDDGLRSSKKLREDDEILEVRNNE